MKYSISEILDKFKIPAILILVVIGALLIFNIREASDVILGVTLGVVLGFAADLIKKELDSLNRKQKFKEISLRLLGEDAESIYRTFWLWEWARKSFQRPKDVKKLTPPMISLNYWDILKHDKEFLVLGVDSPFKQIFNCMWSFESTNSEIKLAKRGEEEDINIAVRTFDNTTKEKYHKRLLLLFKTEQEIKELEEKYSRSVNTKK